MGSSKEPMSLHDRCSADNESECDWVCSRPLPEDDSILD